jgi:predicted acetyltransferase
MKKYRGQGVGEQVANYIFNLFPGQWEIRQFAENVAAQAFWKRVIARRCGGRFEQVYLR